MIPTIAIIGQRSNVTSFIKDLITSLQHRGLNVMLVKYISEKDFIVDTEAQSTRWPVKGANPIVYASDFRTIIIYKRSETEFSLKELVKYAMKNTDLIMLENFSGQPVEGEPLAKVLMVKDKLEYDKYLKEITGMVLCICSSSPIQSFDENKDVLDAKKSLDIIVDRITSFINSEKEVNNILDKLAGLNCGKCGYKSCLELAKAIKVGKASIEKCAPISLKTKLKCKIVLNEKEIYMQPFVSEMVRKSVLGMLSTLKGVEVDGNESIEVKVHQ